MDYMLSFVFTEDAFRVDRPEDVLTVPEEELKAVFRRIFRSATAVWKRRCRDAEKPPTK